ncbi:serine hydrolase domain-containing protein [Epilithonimonas hungarica]|uniref:CubicO group peptidase, beta-lactamase class C family n=1 Tax=Epilithonimonas hungarica TaxID=454006 RepID=A0A1G7ISK7_9FLAO|nr:serine hydrolase domain-containing protein [Epilithonimonas hungarica]SDF15556.1 CubicO group peptidase, beta-lactamase class C family [Epilithonimonas hungarica]
MKRLFIFTFIFFVSVFYSQQANQVKHLNGTHVLTKTLRERLAHIVDSSHITGLQVAIINENKLVWVSSLGYKDTEYKKPLNDSTVMYGASLTKPVSAYIFLRLADKGILDLDRPVYTYLKRPIGEYPKWKDLAEDTVAFKRITPRMLLDHSSGMPVLRHLYNDKVSLIAKPGERFYYSNEGINLLGYMIEEYTGKKLENIAREEVFGPLKMTHTSMVWEKAFENNFSYAYFKDGSKYGSERRESSRAAGSMSTTADDYALFIAQLMMRKGLSQHFSEQMLSPQVFIKSKRGFGPLKDSLTSENDAIKLAWGLGVGLFRSPYGLGFFHTGHGEANQNLAVAFPEKGIAVILMSNSENFEKASNQILKACIGDSDTPLVWLGHLDN